VAGVTESRTHVPSRQRKPVSHCAVSMHVPPSGTLVAVGAAVSVGVDVGGVGVSVRVGVNVTQVGPQTSTPPQSVSILTCPSGHLCNVKPEHPPRSAQSVSHAP